MKRAVYAIPEGLTLELLTEEQQAAIAVVEAQFRNPMPGTQIYQAQQVVDGIVDDTFDPLVLPALGLSDWTLLALYQWDGQIFHELHPLDEQAFYPFLPDIKIYDESGNVVETSPAVLHLPHNWSGWPSIPVGNPE